MWFVLILLAARTWRRVKFDLYVRISLTLILALNIQRGRVALLVRTAMDVV